MCLRALLAIMLLIPVSVAHSEPMMLPRIAGDWIEIASDPDLGGLTAPRQQPVDFAIWQAADGRWQLWSCIRASTDGKRFTRRANANGQTGMFTEGQGNNTRDPMAINIGGKWHCYYTAFPNKQGAVYCRTSEDTREWSESKIVAFGGQAGTNAFSAECPFVVELVRGQFYLFRTQKYGADAITRVYHSHDPLHFGINEDSKYLVSSLPVAAPELILHGGQWYIAALAPTLKGIRLARLEWAKQER